MLRKIPFHPILFAGFCVLALMSHNIGEIPLKDMWMSLMLALLIGVIIYALTRLFIHDWHRAALAALAILFCFFTYGQVYAILANVNAQLFRHRNFLALYGLLLIFALYWIIRKTKKPESWTYWLNLLSIYLLIYPTFVMSSYALRQFMAYRAAASTKVAKAQAANSVRPDIYYIILDAYGRQDVFESLLAVFQDTNRLQNQERQHQNGDHGKNCPERQRGAHRRHVVLP